MKLARATVLLVALTFCTAGCSDDSSGAPDKASSAAKSKTEAAEPDPGAISRSDMGDEWPLKVKQGQLECIGSDGVGAVTFTAPDGTLYALNGTAKGQLDDAADIRPIWANDKELGMGLKKDIGPLIEEGLKLCE